jgi:hypothetical protein
MEGTWNRQRKVATSCMPVAGSHGDSHDGPATHAAAPVPR